MAPNDGLNTRRRRVLRRLISFYLSQNITCNFPETSPVVVHHYTGIRLNLLRIWLPIAVTNTAPNPIPFISKQKRVRLIFFCKQAEIVEQLQLVTTVDHLMQTYDVSLRTLYNIKKEDDISKAVTETLASLKTKQKEHCTFQNWKRSCTTSQSFVGQTNFLFPVVSFNSVYI